MDTSSVLPENWQGNNTAAAIRVAGERIYVSLRGCDQVAALMHHEGALSEPIFVDTEGNCPRDINIIRDLLFCANENSDCITVFRLENEGLRFVNIPISVPKPLCIVFSNPGKT